MTSWFLTLPLLTGTLISGAPFQNLGFDDANTNNLSPRSFSDGVASIGEMLPGWQTFWGTFQQQTMPLNQLLAGLGYSSLFNAGRLNRASLLPFEVKYSFGMFPGYDLQGDYVPYTLLQTGGIPSDAKTIRFLSYGSPVELRINGNLIPLDYAYTSDLVRDQRTGTAVGDVSAFAGQNVELKFTTIDIADSVVNGLDSIFFSTIPIPEPSIIALAALGALLLFGGRRSRW